MLQTTEAVSAEMPLSPLLLIANASAPVALGIEFGPELRSTQLRLVEVVVREMVGAPGGRWRRRTERPADAPA